MKFIEFFSKVFVGAIVVAAVFILTYMQAHADTIDFDLMTYSSSNDYDYNESTPGIGISIEVKNWLDVRTGLYNNEHDKTSVYLLAHPKHRINKHFSMGTNIGIVTGYSNIRTETTDELCLTLSKKDDDDKPPPSSTVCREGTESNDLENHNKFRFVLEPTIRWHINKKHALQLSMRPDLEGIGSNSIGLQYSYSIK